MSNNLYMPLHPGDYLTDTAHLSAAEHGAYMLLIMNYWQKGEPLPRDERKLRMIARMSAEEWADARQNVLEFFEERDGQLFHKRIEAELERAREKSDKAKSSGRQSQSGRRANAERTLTERSTNQEQEQDQAQEGNNNQQQPVTPREEAAAAVDWQDLKAKCAEVVPAANGFSVVERWAADGLDLDRAMALVREIGADMRQRGKPAQSLVAFDKAVRDRTRQPKAAFRPASVPMVSVPRDSPDWPRAAAAWAAERGKPPPVVNGGWAFPAHMLDNTKH